MTQFEQVMMNRDGMTEVEAKRVRDEAEQALYAILSEGGGYDDVEDLMYSEYGLEMDFIFDLL